MRKRATAAAGLLLCLTLTACPGSRYDFRPSLVPAGIGATSLIFTATDVSIARGTGVPMGDPARRRPAPLIANRYTLWAGDEMIWQIERAPEPPPGKKCDLNDLPSVIDYGTAPICFRETMPAKPLEQGRAYRMQGPEWQTIEFVYADPIQLLSARGYAYKTRKWRDTHQR